MGSWRIRMASTYRAVEISSPGVFSLVERKVAVPGAGQVRIRVEACGVCHSDAATVEAQFPNLSYPRVPGHEVIGRIEEVGLGVTAWKVDQRVGVGFFGGEDGTCEACRRGETAYCQNAIMTGITTEIAYAIAPCSSPMSDGTPIVFVVDDDVSVRESLELLIRFEGWLPEIFASAQEFLSRPRVLVPSCLILDVSLPGLNGLDLQ